jgi:hypothetical protein
MLHFAYDGSIHGDWVAHYAIRLAGRLPQPGLRLLHVEDARLSRGRLKQRLERIAAECRMLSVPLEVGIHPERQSVLATLQALVPSGSGHYLVCGTRMRQRGFLAITYSEMAEWSDWICNFTHRYPPPAVARGSDGASQYAYDCHRRSRNRVPSTAADPTSPLWVRRVHGHAACSVALSCTVSEAKSLEWGREHARHLSDDRGSSSGGTAERTVRFESCANALGPRPPASRSDLSPVLPP